MSENRQHPGRPAPILGSMELTPEACYQALLCRDRRFDGRFFIGVRTTGVYCRPVCPAPSPKFGNIEFFPCAAAAEEAGFRPCLRCRPETAPGTPAWDGTSATVRRALRLIAGGSLEGNDISALANRLGVGDRHLRRLFITHLGVGPAAVARTQRVHLARRLVDETSLPMTRIAFAAGFSSVRQFNDTFRACFGQAPSALRKQPGKRSSSPSGPLRVRLSYRPPFDFAGILKFLALRGTPGVERVDAETYARTFRLGEASGTVLVEHRRDKHLLELSIHSAAIRHLGELIERVRCLFDLYADPAAVSRDLSCDPLLAPLVRARPGLRLPGGWDFFELATRAILGQQVSVRAATTMAGRLTQAFGQPILPASDGLTHLFPTPAALADADLAAIGLTKQRAASLRGLAEATANGDLDPATLTDLPATIERLCRLRGIGPWTAGYIAMRALGEANALPAGDLELRKVLGTGGALASPSEVARRAEKWRPWRAYAVIHLWAAAGESQ